MTSYKFFLWGVLLLSFSVFLACEKENFDLTESIIGSGDPEITELDPHTMETTITGLDTLFIVSDSVYVDQVGDLVSMYGISVEGSPSETYLLNLEFEAPGNPDNLDLGTYALTLIRLQEIEYINGVGITVSDIVWQGMQLDGSIEITASETIVKDYTPSGFANTISGFIDAELTDDEGNTQNFNAAFNQLVRIKL